MAAFIAPIAGLLDRILPDKAANAAAKAQLLQLQTNGELQAILGQINVDQAEAASNNKFAADWRPFVGYVLGSIFAYNFLIQPFLIFIATAFHVTLDMSQLPKLDVATTMPVLLGMLGLGGLHTYESVNASPQK